MPIHKAVVAAPVGLHARPAAAFVRAVTDTGLPVTISKAGAGKVDARSLLQVMTADFPQGCEVELAISDAAVDGALGRQNAEDALQRLGRLLEAQADAQDY
ncbi:HPr family phosphocarrier protein [Pseudarthrobacter phenanthrenivorans]|uniref:Phosphocarrier protein HPr n=1 Tax=Pseudarthrobacter phenanthrenivorans TaxID=361575 RepID=A0A0B4DCS5_PSEPS|nr:HPr family phosphocarrier protein [Pseudarthrobacter phenanthrenivorans]KIC62135.1 phosphotransferase [Pseudarthrobacter phenanthrenivorans]